HACFSLSACFSGALLRRGLRSFSCLRCCLGRCTRLRGRSARSCSFLRGDGLGPLCLSVGRLCGFRFLRRLLLCRTLWLAAGLGGTLLDQRDGFGQRELFGLDIVRNGRVNAVDGDVSTVPALLPHNSAAACRIVADSNARVRAEAAAWALGNLLCDQRYGAVEADGVDIFASLQ